MKRSSLMATATMIALLGTGCDREAIAARDIGADRHHVVSFGAADCGDEVIVPHGFSMGWKRFNHRLSKWGLTLDKEECTARHVEVTHVGGVFSKNPVIDDTPTVEFAYQRVRLSEGIAVARVAVTDVVGADGAIEGEVRFTTSELGLDGFETYTALIEGIRYDTGIEQLDDYPSLYNPARGYTVRGLGAGIDVRHVDGQLVLHYSARFVPGRTPERIFMNWAIPHARIGAGIEAIIIATNDVPVNRGAITYSAEHERTKLLNDVRLPRTEETARTVSLAGRPDSPRGFWGLQAFNFEFDFDGACDVDADCTIGSCDEGRCDVGFGKLGEYIREFSVGVEMKGFDVDTGRGLFVVDGYSSNASSFVSYHPLRYAFGGKFAWFQASADVSQHTLGREFDTGSVTVPFDQRQ